MGYNSHPMTPSRPFHARGPAVALALAAALPLLLGARHKPPRSKPLSGATAAAVSRAERLGSRSEAEWEALEQLYRSGGISRAGLDELRIYWAATADPEYDRTRWTMRLMNAGMDLRTALALPAALEAGDLQSLDDAIQAYRDGGGEERVELLLLQTAAAWGLGKESRAALLYKTVRREDAVLAYYDALLEQWLRARAAEVLAHRPATYVPADEQMAESLRQNLRQRGQWGMLVLEFLEPAPVDAAGRTPVAALDGDVVAEIVDSTRVDLYFCYEREGGEDRLGAGAMTLDMGIDPFGRVTFCSVTPGATVRNRMVQDCACQVMRDTRFPCPDGGGMASVRYDVEFPIRH